MTEPLSLLASPELLEAIARHKRKRETVEGLFLRLLHQRKRSDDLVRKQRIHSLERSIEYLDAQNRAARAVIERRRRELAEMQAQSD